MLEGKVQKVIMFTKNNQSEREVHKEKMMSRAEIGGTLDFPDIITPDPFQMAYQSKHHASQSDILSVWSSQMQEKKDSNRRSRKELIEADNAYLSVLKDKENQEMLNQRSRSAKAKEV